MNVNALPVHPQKKNQVSFVMMPVNLNLSNKSAKFILFNFFFPLTPLFCLLSIGFATAMHIYWKNS